MVVDISKMESYESPISPSLYPQLATILLGIGLMLASWFFMFEVTATKKTRNLFKEITAAGAVAGFLGFGSVFLIMSVGIYI